MKIHNFQQKKDSLIKDNIVFKFTIVVLTLLVVFLVYIIVVRTDSQRTVFLPPQATYKEFWVSGDTVSKSYLSTIGEFIAYNLLNVDKSDANELLSNILPLVDSRSYYEVKKQLQLMQDYIVSNNISRAFYISNVVDKTPTEIIVNGSIKDSISTKIIDIRRVKLIVSYKIKFGLFRIVNLKLEKE